jgi:rSAM-partnered protein
MTDGRERTPVTDPRSDEVPEWEVFVREAAADPLRHAGSVSAPAADVAHEQAATLVGGDAHTLWLCPAAEVHRFTARRLER